MDESSMCMDMYVYMCVGVYINISLFCLNYFE